MKQTNLLESENMSQITRASFTFVFSGRKLQMPYPTHETASQGSNLVKLKEEKNKKKTPKPQAPKSLTLGVNIPKA